MRYLEWIDGYKTYILVLAAVILWLGILLKWWTMDQVDELFALFAILGVGAARSALKKIE